MEWYEKLPVARTDKVEISVADGSEEPVATAAPDMAGGEVK
ncbi:MAG TPA: hypothetical protein VGJ94_15110 [Syntrophorhabdaceae bacterium]